MTLELNPIQHILQLERIEENIFRGQSQNIGTPQVYGGQVLGQAIAAAQLTVDSRPVHSVHAYFLRKGDFNAPILYEVDRNREGRSFSARRVLAIQHGQPIFSLAASFQEPEDGLEFQDAIVLPDLETAIPLFPKNKKVSDDSSIVNPNHYFDIRIHPAAEGENSLSFWIKTCDALPDNDDLHREVLAYVSDFALLYSALVPHGYNFLNAKKTLSELSLASIDHAIWYHRPFRADDWLFYQCSPISTSGGRGLGRGSFTNSEGQLVATTIQEGLMRKLK